MKKLILISCVVLITSCAGMKVERTEDVEKRQSKPGVTWGGPAVSGGGIQAVGYECTVHAGMLYYSATGGTEDEATRYAIDRCKSFQPDGSCNGATCKHL